MATTMHTETSVDSSGKTREVEVFVFHNPAKRKKDRENAEVNVRILKFDFVYVQKERPTIQMMIELSKSH